MSQSASDWRDERCERTMESPSRSQTRGRCSGAVFGAGARLCGGCQASAEPFPGQGAPRKLQVTSPNHMDPTCKTPTACRPWSQWDRFLGRPREDSRGGSASLAERGE